MADNSMDFMKSPWIALISLLPGCWWIRWTLS